MTISKRLSVLALTVIMIMTFMPFTVNAATKRGWVKEGSDWYYYDTSGHVCTGWLKDNNKWYFLDSSGRMCTGWVKDKGDWFYLDAGGVMQTGWVQDNGKWFYLDKDTGAMFRDKWLWETNSAGVYVGYHFSKATGEMERSQWTQNRKGEWLYLTSNGSTALGWNKIGGKWYYFNDRVDNNDARYGIMLKDSWLDDTYYFMADGAMATSKWVKVYDGSPYYCQWAYVDKYGKRITNGWNKIDGKWYYFYSDGIAAAGDSVIGGKKYFFDNLNAFMYTGWFHKTSGSNSWYCARGDGTLYVNGWYQIGGYWYQFGTTGQCMNPDEHRTSRPQ